MCQPATCAACILKTFDRNISHGIHDFAESGIHHSPIWVSLHGKCQPTVWHCTLAKSRTPQHRDEEVVGIVTQEDLHICFMACSATSRLGSVIFGPDVASTVGGGDSLPGCSLSDLGLSCVHALLALLRIQKPLLRFSRNKAMPLPVDTFKLIF
jgi:hypothetical protein